MRKQHPRKKRRVPPKTVLRLPDLEQAKSAVLNSLGSRMLSEDTGTPSTHSSSGIARNRGFRSPGTVNLRLGAVRRLA